MNSAMLSLLLLLASSVNVASSTASSEDHTGDTVHIVFSNHLDIGFGGIWPELGYDDNVINMYFDWYIPTAIRMGQYFAAQGGPESHIYTMHSYIASLYMSCPPDMGLHCPSEAQQADFCQAVQDGHITWTAFPYNAQVEMMDEETILGALQLTHDLDHLCGVPVKTVISQRDVPGMTRGVLPVVTELWWGPVVRAISVGVNGASPAPAVPLNTPFVWRDEATGSQVVAFWHPGGYGGKSGYKGHTLALTPAPDCVRTPAGASGGRHILCFSWRGDNKGPFDDPKEVLLIFEAARAAFPGAAVRASTFEAFVDELMPHAGALEVVTAEIGDSWIHGVASDPVKTKNYRAMMRMRSQCLYDGGCVIQDPAFQNFTRLFLKAPEHTWGIDSKTAPASWDTWDNAAFRPARNGSEKFAQAEHSWARQSRYIEWSLQALYNQPHTLYPKPLAASAITTADMANDDTAAPARPPHALAAAASGHMDRLRTSHADAEARIHPDNLLEVLGCGSTQRTARDAQHGRAAVEDQVGGAVGCGDGGEVVLNADGWYIAVDSTTGAITSLRRTWPDDDGTQHPGTDWAAGGTFAQLQYSTYSADYFKRWGSQYNPMGEGWYDVPWMRYDYGKPGAEVAAKDRAATPALVSVNLYTGQYDGQLGIAIRYRFSGWPVDEAGAPPSLTLLVHTWHGADTVMMDVLYSHKLPTRLPEALWLRFVPAAVDPASMLISKVGSLISPGDIIRNGSFNLHAAMDGGVHLRSAQHGWEQLQLAAMDTALVAVGDPEVLPDTRGPARPDCGLAFNLLNNAWGTNYVMWTPYGDGVGSSIKSRFVVTVRDTRTAPPAGPSLLRDPHLANVPRDLLI